MQLALPALAERPDDILPLARYFLGGEKNLSHDAEQLLLSYHWPGNVRELQNACQRALLLSNNSTINSANLGLPDTSSAGKRALDDIDRSAIDQALLQAGGVISRAAKQLGISRQALYRRMEFYGIETP